MNHPDIIKLKDVDVSGDMISFIPITENNRRIFIKADGLIGILHRHRGISMVDDRAIPPAFRFKYDDIVEDIPESRVTFQIEDLEYISRNIIEAAMKSGDRSIGAQPDISNIKLHIIGGLPEDISKYIRSEDTYVIFTTSKVRIDIEKIILSGSMSSIVMLRLNSSEFRSEKFTEGHYDDII